MLIELQKIQTRYFEKKVFFHIEKLMNKKNVIVQDFQKKRNTNKKKHQNINDCFFKQIFRFKFIVEIIKIMTNEFTFTKNQNFIIFELDDITNTKIQISKRIYRITQIKKYTIYRILYLSSSKNIQILKRHKTRQRFILNIYNEKIISKIIKKTMNELIQKKIKKIKLMKKNKQKKK